MTVLQFLAENLPEAPLLAAPIAILLYLWFFRHIYTERSKVQRETIVFLKEQNQLIKEHFEEEKRRYEALEEKINNKKRGAE